MFGLGKKDDGAIDPRARKEGESDADFAARIAALDATAAQRVRLDGETDEAYATRMAGLDAKAAEVANGKTAEEIAAEQAGRARGGDGTIKPRTLQPGEKLKEGELPAGATVAPGAALDLEHEELDVHEEVEDFERPRPRALRTDGPTLAEFVAAGYKADDYPPEGYEAKTDPRDETASAVVAEGRVVHGRVFGKPVVFREGETVTDTAEEIERLKRIGFVVDLPADA